MKNPRAAMASLAVASLLLSGCATAAGSTDSAASTAPSAPAPESTSAAPVASGPSEASKMICGPETKDDVSSILALNEAPHTISKWADGTYTCTYHLADGPLVISVKESPDPASARKYFDALEGKIGNTAPIKGLSNLGFPAYQTNDGSVVFLKDNSTLYVNATKLPAAVGPQQVTPTAFAYQVSTTILACWTEHH
ncbi:hypothetical protein B1A87_001155 [Arthrobacter sp. KBS0703]|uniref:hypothetical protein n=1 Tax=Arthrobacter sp. KBS0703 TaxID=1955698 RepID=UPI00098EE66D|nr:hypothetical protein [Arthrobacter sp. KBS0703]TSE14749.1 hypothetical protein B1A87_001155 [Arthrobacter sp. KBS0703]